MPACTSLRIPTDYEEMLQEIINSVLTPLVVIGGTILNVRYMRKVYKMLGERQSFLMNIIILTTGLNDTILLLLSFFYYAIKDMLPWYRSTFNIFTPFLHGVGQVANTGSIWCVLAIVALKHWAVGDPFRGAMVLNSFRSQRKPSGPHGSVRSLSKSDIGTPVVIMLLAFILNLPAFFEIGHKECRLADGTTFNELYIRDMRKNPNYRRYYKMGLRMLLVSCLPNLFILGLTAFTWIKVRRADRERRLLFVSDKEADNGIYTVKEQMQKWSAIVIGVKFILLRSPSFVLDILEILHFHDKRSAAIFASGVHISNFLILVNSATNCLLFVKVVSWMKRKITRMNRIKKKELNELLCLHNTPRLTVLEESWTEILEKTDNRLGERLLHSMISKDMDAYNMFKLPTQPAEVPKCAWPGNNVTACVISNGRKYGTTSDTCLLLSKKKSIEMCKNPKFFEVSVRITSFISELLEALRKGERMEVEVIGKLHNVGAEHNRRNIRFTNPMWSEFKNCFMNAVAECERDSQPELIELKDAWSSFISLIIKEIKLGAAVSKKHNVSTRI
uniref:G_PROTEIN_RECEP_F1_2 domain-containing protein n=1 Tax=Steinernema glaseri TaxID=37863 RepID=A0A1I8A8U6_9BILA